MTIPRVYFKYAYPLDRDRRELFEEKNLGSYPSSDEVREKVVEWRKIWAEQNAEDKIMKRLIELVGVSPPRDIEAYIFGSGLNAMSNPLIIPIKNMRGIALTDEQFVVTLIHEISHRLVGQSDENEKIRKFWEWFRNEYANEKKLTQNHILIYAILEIIITEIFGEEKKKGL